MYVCICHAVTEREVGAAIEAGADTVAGVGAACGAGHDCGACHETIGSMLRENECKHRLPLLDERAA